jgi:hypothetical protein
MENEPQVLYNANIEEMVVVLSSGSTVSPKSKGVAREKLMVSSRSVGPPGRPLKIFLEETYWSPG